MFQIFYLSYCYLKLNSLFPKVTLSKGLDKLFSSAGLGISIDLEKGEYMNLFEGEGVSCKYTLEQIRTLVQTGKQRLCKVWMDSKQYVAVFCTSKS